MARHLAHIHKICVDTPPPWALATLHNCSTHPPLNQQDYDRIMGTNLESTYALCQLFQPLLAAGAAGGPQVLQQQQQQGPPAALDPISRAKAAPTGDACIIFISSVAGGPLAGRSGSLYAASKAALNQLAASFACEWAGQGIRVNSIAPWVTLTELGQQVG
jgi:Tropinone reductase 1